MSNAIIFTLDHKLVKLLPKFGYERLTEIQQKTIPKILLDNKDLLIISPTGSGKTEAVFFPLISLILKNPNKKIFAIYVTPLRSLNRDIFKRMKEICEELNIKVAVLHSDTTRSERREIYKDPPHILITTPETLDALSIFNFFISNLRNLNFLIIDEVHEIIESKRGIGLLLAIERLKIFSKNNFRIIGLSATLSDPIYVSNYLFDKDFAIVSTSDDKIAEVTIYFEPHDHIQKFTKILHELFERNKSMIIFTNTRSLAEYISYILKDKLDFNVEVHHSSLGREIRESIEGELKKGALKAVVATSSLEHGIDMPYVDAIFQYGSPIQSIVFKQRVGRSMHKEKLISRGYIIAFNPIEAFESYIIALRSNENKLERVKVQTNSLELLAHHIAGLLLYLEVIEIAKLYEAIKKIKLYNGLEYYDFLKLIEHLKSIRICYEKDEKLYPLKLKCKIYYYNTFSTIFEEPLYTCVDVSTRRIIGKVDGSYILNAHTNNNGIVLAGKAWKIVDIDEENMRCELIPITEESEIPIWSGEMLPVSKEVSNEVFELIGSLSQKLDKINLFNTNGMVKFDEKSEHYIKDFLNNLLLEFPVRINSKMFIIEKCNNIVSIMNPNGSKINRALSIFLKGFLKDNLVSLIEHPYGIVLYLKKEINLKSILEFIEKIPKFVKNNDYELKEILLKDSRYLSTLKRVSLFLGLVSKENLNKMTNNMLVSLNETFAGDVALREFLNNVIDYTDLEDLINSIINREIKILMYELRNPSVITRVYLTKVPYLKDLIKGTTVLSIYDAVEKRLLNEQMLFVCIACKNSFQKKVMELEEQIVCNRCGSIKIACLNPYDENLMEAVKAFMNSSRKLLKNKFVNEFKRILTSAEIISIYGKIGAMVLAGHGIGPEFARRILIEWNGDKEELIKTIIQYEAKFSQTKRFWKDS